MPRYRAYQFDKEERVIGLPLIVDCDNDELAIAKAKLVLDFGDHIDVWNGDRFVTRFQLHPKAKNSSR